MWSLYTNGETPLLLWEIISSISMLWCEFREEEGLVLVWKDLWNSFERMSSWLSTDLSWGDMLWTMWSRCSCTLYVWKEEGYNEMLWYSRDERIWWTEYTTNCFGVWWRMWSCERDKWCEDREENIIESLLHLDCIVCNYCSGYSILVPFLCLIQTMNPQQYYKLTSLCGGIRSWHMSRIRVGRTWIVIGFIHRNRTTIWIPSFIFSAHMIPDPSISKGILFMNTSVNCLHGTWEVEAAYR